MPTRRERIEALLLEDPRDSFLRYSLALELEKEGRHDESLAGLTGLTKDVPPYIPAFLMGGQQLVKLSRIEEARALLREGIEQARSAGNLHAAGEIAELLTSLGSF